MKKKSNILFINHVSSKKFGGAEKVLDDIILGLVDKGFNVTLLLQDVSAESDEVDFDCAKNINVNVEYFDFGSLSHGNKLISLILMLLRIVRAFFVIGFIIKKHDVKVVCANSLIAGAVSALPSKLFSSHFYYYEHNIASQRKGRLIGLALKPVSWMASKIICISQAVKDGLINEGVRESKLCVIHNGYNFKEFSEAIKQDRGLPPRHQANQLRIGMVANFIPWKRHSVFLELVEAFSVRFPSVKVDATLIGGCLPGSEDYYDEIGEWIRSYKGNVNFQMVGFQDNVSEYLQSFDVLINPAEAEPFGLIFIEAMYLKCNVFGSVNGAAPEIIVHNKTGFVVDYEHTDIFGILGMLADDVDTRIEIGENAATAVSDDFSLAKQVDKLENLFDAGL